jgi:hypothetical protein
MFMSLNISYRSDGNSEQITDKSPNGLSKDGKVSFREMKGKPHFKHIKTGEKSSDVFYGIIHCAYLSVLVNDKPWGEVIRLPKEITLSCALECIKQYGKDFAERLISTDSNSCLWWNIIFHLGSFDAVSEGESL